MPRSQAKSEKRTARCWLEVAVRLPATADLLVFEVILHVGFVPLLTHPLLPLVI